tara:strand:+ start:58 stop:342 length:285 start_codon:yes stop_codon:yes gene_type:complete
MAKQEMRKGTCRSFTKSNGKQGRICRGNDGRVKFAKTGRKGSGGVAGSTRTKKSGGRAPLKNNQCRTVQVKGQKSRRYCRSGGKTRRVALNHRT